MDLILLRRALSPKAFSHRPFRLCETSVFHLHEHEACMTKWLTTAYWLFAIAFVWFEHS